MSDSMERKDVDVTANNTPNDENMMKKEAAAEAKQDAAPQKKKMSAVFRPQNSAQGGRPGTGQRRPVGAGGTASGQRRLVGAGGAADGQRRTARASTSAGATTRCPASEVGNVVRRSVGVGVTAPVRKPVVKPEEVKTAEETKPEVKAASAPEVKAEAKAAPAPEAKPAVKATPAPEVKPATPGKGLAIAAMVTGILSFLCFPYVFGVLGIVFGGVAKSKGCKSGMATAGIACGAVGIALWLLMLVACSSTGLMSLM